MNQLHKDNEELIKKEFTEKKLNYSLLKDIREYKKDFYTTKEIAKEIGVAVTTVSNYAKRVREIIGLPRIKDNSTMKARKLIEKISSVANTVKSKISTDKKITNQV